MSRRPRVFRPHHDWLWLDFVLAAMGMLCLVVAVSGLALVAGAASDLSSIASECSGKACTHSGTLVDRNRIYWPGGGVFGVAPELDVCQVTLDLDVGRRVVGIAGSLCPRLSVPSPVSVQMWNGAVIAIRIDGANFATNQHPSFQLLAGALRVLALIPLALFVALIELDIAHHRPVWKVRRHRTLLEHD